MKTHVVRIHKTCNAPDAGRPLRARRGMAPKGPQVTRSSSLSLMLPGTIVIGTESFAA
jgi:hypothetical protein